ncbi:hypothetical protein ABIB45_004113 [Arthrobacter sp. UYCo732]
MLVVALAILSAVSPMATDMYLASMPRMGEFFATPASVVQHSAVPMAVCSALAVAAVMAGSRADAPHTLTPRTGTTGLSTI